MSNALSQWIHKSLTEGQAAAGAPGGDELARAEIAGNFCRLILSYLCTKLGDAIANPKTVLAWVSSAVGAPPAILGMLVPVRESLSMIPQVFIAGFVRRRAVRKWIWVCGSIAQGLSVAAMGWVAVSMQGLAAGIAILLLISLFSLARGFCSVAAKDVLGKTIPKQQRGQLTGWSASAAGLVTVVVGVILLAPPAANAGVNLYGWLLGAAACLWVIAALIYARIKEFPGETAAQQNTLSNAWNRLNIVRTDRAFRRFIIARALLMSSALSAPFYVALGQQQESSSTGTLGLLIVAGGLASLLSAPFWGKFSDHSSRWVMMIAGGMTAMAGFTVMTIALLDSVLLANSAFIPLAFFALSIAHAGVRIGRKTYVVDLGTGNQRTDYVAVSNTIIGWLLLATGALSMVASLFSTAIVIGLLSLMALAGAFMGRRLPEVEKSAHN